MYFILIFFYVKVRIIISLKYNLDTCSMKGYIICDAYNLLLVYFYLVFMNLNIFW